ncbi:MAG: rhomboid family protein [uncultured archaeon A07HR60]|nr:MAG: rhomboid family protein [uncultured archaeon A07HR60]
MSGRSGARSGPARDPSDVGVTQQSPSLGQRVAQSPTAHTLAVILGVFALQQVTAFLGTARALFLLDPTFLARPWAIVTSVYAHAGPSHLLGNAVALVLLGLLLERHTSTFRYHLFFISTGAIAGLAQVVLGSLTGLPQGVLGASGAIFAVLGYLIAGNTASVTLLDSLRLPPRVQLGLGAIIAVGVTVATGGAGVALIAHFTGLLLGLVAGRLRLLDVGSSAINHDHNTQPETRNNRYK